MIHHINGVLGSLEHADGHNPMDPTSIPDFDSWGPDLNMWDCEDWKTWHGTLKKAKGKKKADAIWVDAWQSQGMGAEPLNCRSFDTSFRKWAAAEKLEDRLYWGIGVLAKPIGYGDDVIEAVKESSPWIAPAIAAVVAAYLLYMYAPKRR